jgi:hypothetical protein
MNLLEPTHIEERIVRLLQKRSLSGMDLVAEIRKVHPNTTKQAVYQALRRMKRGEIVATHGKTVSLSRVWVLKMAEFFAVARHYYVQNVTGDEGFLNLADGDRVSYTFTSPNMTDIFWGHAFDILAEVTPVTEPIYIYNPHEWFFLARHESERLLFDRVVESGRQIFVVASHADTLDKMVGKEFDGKNTQYYLSPEKLFEKNNYYVNVFGNFVVEAWLDEDVAEKIDRFYKKTMVWDEAAKKELIGIVSEKGKTKLTILHNSKKAQKMKAVLGKHFWIRK